MLYNILAFSTICTVFVFLQGKEKLAREVSEICLIWHGKTHYLGNKNIYLLGDVFSLESYDLNELNRMYGDIIQWQYYNTIFSINTIILQFMKQTFIFFRLFCIGSTWSKRWQGKNPFNTSDINNLCNHACIPFLQLHKYWISHNISCYGFKDDSWNVRAEGSFFI